MDLCDLPIPFHNLVGFGAVWSRKLATLFPLQLITSFCVNCCDVDVVLLLLVDEDNATQKSTLSSHSTETVIDLYYFATMGSAVSCMHWEYFVKGVICESVKTRGLFSQ